MKKEELIRYKAGLAALLLSSGMLFGGCSFDKVVSEEDKSIVQTDSNIHNNFLEKCSVVEVQNNSTNETNIYIVYKKASKDLPITIKECIDIFTGEVLYTTDNIISGEYRQIKETPLFDYMITLNLVKENYSKEDIENIYNKIKEVYEFETDKELVK